MKADAILILRPSGPRNVTHAQGVTVVETSLNTLEFVASARAVLANYAFGAVILEDLRLADLPAPVLDAVKAGVREGVSCPIVTRWTRPDPNA